MKKTWIVLLIICITIFFTFSIKGNAAELYGTEIYLMQEVWNSNTGSQESNMSGILKNWGLRSTSPIYLYYYVPDMAPAGSYTDVVLFAISQNGITCDADTTSTNSTMTDSNGQLWYIWQGGITKSFARPYYAYLSLDVGGAENTYKLNQIYNVNEFISNYINGTLDYEVIIDFNNPVFNENIGYLQNVGLKITGVGGNDFTLTWAVENSEYLSDDYRVQIGYMTNFTRELLGEQKAYTNMDLITWEDALYYSVGRKEFKLKELWNMIPDAISYSHNGYFLLRIIHVDEKTGLYETGGWVQVHYILGDGEKDIVVSTPILSSTISEKKGLVISDAYEVEYVEDTNAGGSYYINSANGSVDNISTFIGNATEDWDLSEAANYFYNGITSIVGSLAQFPSLVSKVASFLPNEVMVIIGISIVAIILLRFLGR